MFKFTVVLVAVFALQGCIARPGGQGGGHRQRQGQRAQPNANGPFDQFIADTQAFVKNVTTTLGIEELPDSQQIVDNLHQQAQTLASNVDQFTEKLKTEVKAHQPQVDQAIQEVQAKLTETANQLKQAIGPEATAKAEEIKQKVDQGLQEAVDQVQKLVKAVEPDATEAKAKVEEVAKDLLEQINQIGENLQTQVQGNIAQHEGTHKKH